MSLSTHETLEDAVAMGRSLPLTVLPAPHAPDRAMAGGIGVGFRFESEHTGGALSVVEHPFASRSLVPPHVHTREDEFSIVTAGAIGFRSGADEVVLGAGGYIAKPRGEMHAMWNPTDGESRMIEIISPGGFENFFHDLADLVASGSFDAEAMGSFAEAYGLFFDMAWVPELVERYGLDVATG
jgi:quercetin dioxygenase-like cupin family protein